jgi:hypothetical protein
VDQRFREDDGIAGLYGRLYYVVRHALVVPDILRQTRDKVALVAAGNAAKTAVTSVCMSEEECNDG